MTFATHRERQFMEYLLGKGWVKGTILPPSRLTDSLQQKGWIEQQAQGPKNEIFYRMTDIGLKALRSPVPGRPSQAKGRKKWTPEEDRHLLELKAAGTPLEVIAEKLDRTQASVDTRATKLKYQAKGK
jgi:DNA-binding PadR family transcriptional regulator